MSDATHSTTQAAVEVYEAANDIFEGLIAEIRELSRKKPDATLNASKVTLINRVLGDLLSVLSHEPVGKYLQTLDEETLPQVSDALLIMVQFETALKAFYGRYHRYIHNEPTWITKEYLASSSKTGKQ